jgi:hypothetical protein
MVAGWDPILTDESQYYDPLTQTLVAISPSLCTAIMVSQCDVIHVCFINMA